MDQPKSNNAQVAKKDSESEPVKSLRAKVDEQEKLILKLNETIRVLKLGARRLTSGVTVNGVNY
jgi:hypothetical protein